MCNSTIRVRHGVGLGAVAQIDGRPVIQPGCNRVVTVEVASLPAKKFITSTLSPTLPVPPPPSSAACDININSSADHTDASGAVFVTSGGPAPSSTAAASATRPVTHTTKASIPSACPKFKAAAAKTVHKRSDDPNGLNSSGENPVSPKLSTQTWAAPAAALKKKSKKSGQAHCTTVSFLFVGHDISTSEPGSIAAAQREQSTLKQAQRKMRIAHYGRTLGKVAVIPINSSSLGATADTNTAVQPEERRCSFITSNSDPIYVAYHDDEWGVPVHDDRTLFELLVLAGAQVGLDWTTILKKRDNFRAAFAGFDAGVVAKFNERQIATISSEFRIDMGRVRSVFDNSSRILEVMEEFGSLDEYIWGFVNHQPISTRYSSCRKIPVKTSKSEAISKDMVRRGFRFAGPTVIHSFMQAAGLTNDHLLSCPRRRHLLQQFANKGSSTPPLITTTAATSATIQYSS